MPRYLFVLVVIFQSIKGFLFPQYSVLQISLAVSVPVYLTERKVFINNGLQFNYVLPYAASNFYDPQYWQNLGGRALSTENVENTGNINSTKTQKRSASDRFESGKVYQQKREKWDLTAGELYESVEANLKSFDYDETCLLKSICQLARHPFDFNGKEHLLAEIIQFILTPSIHQGFSENEQYEKERYEMAEKIGEMGQDCEDIYRDCEISFLDYVTRLDNEEQ